MEIGKGCFKNVLHRVSQDIVFVLSGNNGVSGSHKIEIDVLLASFCTNEYRLMDNNLSSLIQWGVLSMSLSAAFFEENESLMIFYFFFRIEQSYVLYSTVILSCTVLYNI